VINQKVNRWRYADLWQMRVLQNENNGNINFPPER
jgi:hypothetical protein